MTEDEWKKVKYTLDAFFGSVVMHVDGHMVKFQKNQVGTNKLAIMTYVDGWYRGKWTKEDPEIHYLRPVEKAIWKRKQIEELKKVYGKRQWAKVKTKYEEKYVYYTPLWFAVSSIRRHYEKTFKDIELAKINGEDARPSPTGDLDV
ncbi:MAG: hypothetical protein PHG51_04750 [Candidatus Omnitrophica bacterium]|nr:hypothetical protein [Candidatus Omnitrophota bacterium]